MADTDPMTELLDARAAAKALRVSVSSLYRMIDAGRDVVVAVELGSCLVE